MRRPIITGLKRREPTVDFKTALEAGLTALDDQRVLAIAADDGRLLVSHDVTTIPDHFAKFIQDRSSPGVILISQELPYREAIGRLLRVWNGTEADDWINVLSFLPR